MRRFRRRSYRLSALVALAAVLFAHSALAVAACLDHFHAAHDTPAAHHAGGHTGHSHDHGPSHGQSLLCQIGCEDQAQSRHYVKVFDLPAPVAQKVHVACAGGLLRALPEPRFERRRPFESAAPPPLPLTIVLSRFRN